MVFGVAPGGLANRASALAACAFLEAKQLVVLQAVAFGMGGGLLQKINRDTMSFATKLSHVIYADGSHADIMKAPTGDASKISFPGVACSLLS